MTYANQIDDIVSSLYKKRFLNELSDLENREDTQNSSQDSEGEPRLDTLKYILSKIEKSLVEEKVNIYDEIDGYVYTKPWNKLRPDHKVEKLVEYINTRFSDDSLKKKLINDATYIIHNTKKLNSNKAVLYDYTRRRILYLKALQLSENKEELEIV